MRGVFTEACALAEEKRKCAEDDEALLQGLSRQVNKRGPKEVTELLAYDAANIAKIVAGRRGISRKLRKVVIARIMEDRDDSG